LVVPASEAKQLRSRVRELERLLGRKTLEVEILKAANVPILPKPFEPQTLIQAVNLHRRDQRAGQVAP
jgi:DNA-binding response OmpR family regulator